MQPKASAASQRRPNGPKPLTDCDSFTTLARKAGALEALDRALRQTLPLPLRDQVRFADLHHDRLVFLASTPAWASRLRLLQTQILASARAIGACASAVKVKVVAPDPVPSRPVRAKSLSPATATHLRAAAASLLDPELQALYLALASATESSASSTGDEQP